jgi:hypothetical protein
MNSKVRMDQLVLLIAPDGTIDIRRGCQAGGILKAEKQAMACRWLGTALAVCELYSVAEYQEGIACFDLEDSSEAADPLDGFSQELLWIILRMIIIGGQSMSPFGDDNVNDLLAAKAVADDIRLLVWLREFQHTFTFQLFIFYSLLSISIRMMIMVAII